MGSILRFVSASAVACVLVRFVVACGDDDPAGGGGTTPDGGGIDSSTSDSGGPPIDGGGDTGPVTPNANLDPTFGTNGVVAIAGTEPSSDAVVAVLRQPDGKLVAVIRNVDT